MTNSSVSELNALYSDYTAQEVVRAAIEALFPSRIALVCSFGTESAVLLHMIAAVDRATPVIFLDTLKHFDETLTYRDRLIHRLRLSDVRTVQPVTSDILREDPDGMLWSKNADACCALRKARPLVAAITRFNALFTGRKRHHGDARDQLSVFDLQDGRIKVNPLAYWDGTAVDAYLTRYSLPRHPLSHRGYPSVGCAVCTSRVAPGEDMRAGRWRGSRKTECGIHKMQDQE